MPNRFYISFLRLPLLIRILLIALLVFFTFGISIHFFEPTTFPSIFDGIWWAIITASTVGYGDFVPKSLLGRVTTVFLILLGAGFVSSYFITLATVAVTKQSALSEGKMAFKESGHIVIIGWNERSRKLIKKLTLLKSPQTIVLIDETLKSNPVQSRYVHYIQGKAHMDETILKSNIEKAKKVLITADSGKDELQADMSSILTLLTIKGLCPHVKCIVEILTAEQVINAIRAGADEVIKSNKLLSIFMYNSLQSNGDGLLSNFVQNLQESKFEVIFVNDHLIGKTFKDTYINFFEEKSLLIGIKRAEKTFLNPSHSLQFEKDDQLIIIK